MQLLAFAGDEVEAQQQWIWTQLEGMLEKCELCIREYYRGKVWLMDMLRESYEDEEVTRFSSMLDEWDIKRVAGHLDRATWTLNALSPHDRTVSALDRASMLAIFEVLSSQAILSNEQALCDHFDPPFRLVQTNRRLKILDYIPAATRFLFDESAERRSWALYSWSKFPRPPTASEFEWAVKKPLLDALVQASCQPFQPDLVQRLWQGLLLVVRRLTKEQIRHHMRALDIDPCRLSVEHLAVQTPGLRFLLNTIHTLLDKAPGDFWDAMQTISPQAIVEQTFYNPQYETLLLESREDEPYEKSALKDMLSWIDPFMSSLKDAHRPQACRSLVYQLLTRLQEQRRLPAIVRYHAFQTGLSVLLSTLRSFTDHESSRGSVTSIVLSDTLEVISNNINLFLNPPEFGVEGSEQEIRSLCMDIVRNTLALECQSLKFDYEAILRHNTLQHGVSTYTASIWDAVVQHLDENNIQLSTAALIGILPLVGLESFPVKKENKEKTHFNMIYRHLTHLASQILEKLSDFKSEHLNELFKSQDTNGALISPLFAADLDTYNAAVGLIKALSGQSGRKEAISHLLLTYCAETMHGFSWSFRRISNMRTFGSAPRMLKTGTDIVEVLCDSQTGILRTRTLADHKEAMLLQKLWEYLWLALMTIFTQTETWHRMGIDRNIMLEFCRDSIQFGDLLFDQFPVFSSAIGDADASLLKSPTTTMTGMVKWLRLKDEYLATTIVGLVSKILRRLGDLDVSVPSEALNFIESVALTSTTKTILSDNEKAELIRALEAYHKQPLATPASAPAPKKQKRITAFAKSGGTTTATSSPSSAPASDKDDEFGDQDVPDDVLLQLSSSVEKNKARIAAQQKKKKAEARPLVTPKPAASAASVMSFRERREREKEAKKKRDLQELARLKKNLPARGIGEQTSAQGSGLDAINVGAPEQKAADSMMVSSDTSSDSETDDDDGDLGRKSVAKPEAVKAYEESKKNKLTQRKPVKKVKVPRSAKDMRARLAPDLSSLHKTLLSWDFFATGDLPPNCGRTDYSLVSSTFANALEYQKTFEPLLILEAWQGFQSSKEEGTFKPFEVKIANRLTVDAFVEVSTVMQPNEVKELGLGEADVILLSKSDRPASDPTAPHCLARITRVSKKKGAMEISYRVNPSSGLVSSILPGSTFFGARITSLTPLEREYGALMALPYYDLGDEIIQAKPSPILNYSMETVKEILETYKLNSAQGKAVKSALDNDAFTLVQGYAFFSCVVTELQPC